MVKYVVKFVIKLVVKKSGGGEGGQKTKTGSPDYRTRGPVAPTVLVFNKLLMTVKNNIHMQYTDYE